MNYRRRRSRRVFSTFLLLPRVDDRQGDVVNGDRPGPRATAPTPAARTHDDKLSGARTSQADSVVRRCRSTPMRRPIGTCPVVTHVLPSDPGGALRSRRRIELSRKNGAGDGTRTRDLLITNQLLYQLSYTGTWRDGRSGSGSNHESYHASGLTAGRRSSPTSRSAGRRPLAPRPRRGRRRRPCR